MFLCHLLKACLSPLFLKARDPMIFTYHIRLNIYLLYMWGVHIHTVIINETNENYLVLD